MGIWCRLVGHDRSRTRARYDVSVRTWVSSCRRCARPMAKDLWPSADWQVLSASVSAAREPEPCSWRA